MGPYAYPIQIKKEKQSINFQETKTFETLTIKELSPFVGEFPFDIEQDRYDFYEVTVYKSRLETIDERDIRVQGEENYMVEYNKRKKK